LNHFPYSLMVLAVVGYFAYSYYSFHNDASSERQIALNQHKNKEAQILKIKARIKSAVDFEDSLEDMRFELRKMANTLIEMEKRLNHDLDIPLFIKQTVLKAKKVGLGITKIVPEKEKKEKYYFERGISLSFKGYYPQIVIFLKQLKTSKRLLRIDNIHLTAAGDPQKKHVSLKGTLRILIYRYNWKRL